MCVCACVCCRTYLCKLSHGFRNFHSEECLIAFRRPPSNTVAFFSLRFSPSFGVLFVYWQAVFFYEAGAQRTVAPQQQSIINKWDLATTYINAIKRTDFPLITLFHFPTSRCTHISAQAKATVEGARLNCSGAFGDSRRGRINCCCSQADHSLTSWLRSVCLYCCAIVLFYCLANWKICCCFVLLFVAVLIVIWLGICID